MKTISIIARHVLYVIFFVFFLTAASLFKKHDLWATLVGAYIFGGVIFVFYNSWERGDGLLGMHNKWVPFGILVAILFALMIMAAFEGRIRGIDIADVTDSYLKCDFPISGNALCMTHPLTFS